MKVTDVRVRKIYEEGKMKAIVSVTFNEEFVVHDIKIIDGENGLFIAMPSRRIGESEFRDIAHPINRGTREKIEDAVFEQYQEELKLFKEKNEKTVDSKNDEEIEEETEEEENEKEEVSVE